MAKSDAETKSNVEKAEAELEMAALDAIDLSGNTLPTDEPPKEPAIDENIESASDLPGPEDEPEVSEAGDVPAEDEGIISDAMKQEARACGFSDDEIEKFAAPEQLEAAVSVLHKRLSAVGRSAMTPPPETKAEEKPAEPPAQKQPAAEVDIPRFELKLSKDVEEDYPELVENLRAMNATLDAYHAKLTELETGLNRPVKQMLAQQQAQNETAVRQQFDALCASDDAKQYAEFIGKGKYLELKGDSAERKMRDEILIEMNALAVGYQRMGINFPGLDYLFKRALPAVLGDKIKTRAATEAGEKVSKRQRTFSARPGHMPNNNGRSDRARRGDVTDDEELLAASGLPD